MNGHLTNDKEESEAGISRLHQDEKTQLHEGDSRLHEGSQRHGGENGSENLREREEMSEKKLDELEQLIELMAEKNERIEELEMALHESVQMMEEKERDLDEEEERRKAIMEKVRKKYISVLCIVRSILFFFTHIPFFPY